MPTSDATRRKQMFALRELIVRQGPDLPATGRPISFNDEMVRALLAGRKTQTRRPVKTPVDNACPIAAAGEILWVRERWAMTTTKIPRFVYAADAGPGKVRWRPTFQMPRAAARIMLHVQYIRRQKLQDMTARDARAEGFNTASSSSPLDWFHALWDGIYREGGLTWDDNPRVWVIEFSVAAPLAYNRGHVSHAKRCR